MRDPRVEKIIARHRIMETVIVVAIIGILLAIIIGPKSAAAQEHWTDELLDTVRERQQERRQERDDSAMYWRGTEALIAQQPRSVTVWRDPAGRFFVVRRDDGVTVTCYPDVHGNVRCQ